MSPKRNFSVALSNEELEFLKQLKGRRGNSAGAVVRALIRCTRGFYELPAYQAERLRQDMTARGLDVVEYLQEALALQYERLQQQQRLGEQAPVTPVAPARAGGAKGVGR